MATLKSFQQLRLPSCSDLDEVAALKGRLLQLLDEQHREGEKWLEKHHRAMRETVEAGVLPIAVKLQPEPEEEVTRGVPTPQAPEVMPTATPTRTLIPKSLEKSEASSGSAFSRRVTENIAERRQRAFAKKMTDKGDRPHTSSCCEHFLNEKAATLLETFTGFLIIVNTIVMFVQLELSGRYANEVVEQLELGNNLFSMDTRDPLVFTVLAHIFNAVFVLELLIKLFIYRSKYFGNAWDTFDFVIVVVTSVDLYVLSQISSRQSNISFVRALRILRLARLLRIIRLMNFFQQLRVLLHTMMLSFLSIFWSMLVLLLVMLVSSLLLCQLMQEHVLDVEASNSTRIWANRYYGSSSKSLYTIFEATFSGCWPEYARLLIENVSPWYAAFFVPYVTLVIFTLIRLIYALLLKDTLQAAANDADLVVQDKMRETKATVNRLSGLFTEADVSGDGFLGRKEFEEILAFPKVQVWMAALGLDTQDTQMLFNILDDGDTPDGRISREEFIYGILRMKGHAHKQEVLAAARDLHRILKHCKAMHKVMMRLQPDVENNYNTKAEGHAGTVIV